MPGISNVNELQAINDDLAGDYWLTNGINAAATVGWNDGAGFEPIGNSGDLAPFTGTFNGRGYTISDLYIDRFISRIAPDVYQLGLFGEINGAAIKDVSLTGLDYTGKHAYAGTVGRTGGLVAAVINSIISNCHIAGTITSYGDALGFAATVDADSTVDDCTADVTCTSTDNDAAGFTNWNSGTISNCSSTGDVTSNNDYGAGFANGNGGIISDCFSTGNVSANWGRCGGFVGNNSGTISRSYATGNVVSTQDDVGGFCGYNGATGIINDCYSRGNVEGDDDIGGFVGENDGAITDCYSTGTVTGDVNVGGFCGNNDATITDCFWDTETSGEAASQGGIGKTTSQMQRKSTFTDADWDFIIIWGINKITNAGYPFHWTMPPEPPPDAPRETVLVQDKITLECVRNVEMAAGGRFRIGKDGKAIYRSRYARNA